MIQLPSFQFDEAGRPHNIVLRINELLEVEDDPWGVADWWLGPNGWLGDDTLYPSHLIAEEKKASKFLRTLLV